MVGVSKVLGSILSYNSVFSYFNIKRTRWLDGPFLLLCGSWARVLGLGLLGGGQLQLLLVIFIFSKFKLARKNSSVIFPW